MNAYELHVAICKLKKAAGFGPKQDILKLATEEYAHQYYGGNLIGGVETGRDITESPTHGSVSVKGRPAGSISKRSGLPTKMTPLRTRHWNFDYIVAVIIHPETDEIIGMYEWPKEYFYANKKFDEHDSRWEMSITATHMKQGKFIKNEG